MSSDDRYHDLTTLTTIKYNEHQIAITISIGICRNKNEQFSMDALIANADKALYHSKNSGRNRATL